MEKASPIKIFIVDNHSFIRETMTRLINIQPDMKVVAEAPDGQQAVIFYDHVAPDVTLMDLSMPGMNGIQAIHAIKQKHPKARFILLSAYDFPEDIQRSSHAGAAAYLLKDTTREELIRIIRQVHQGLNFL
jgi:two-component system NarL family response regulator